jgi:HAD superfamily hydrolase (TIGR01509 family)
VKAETELVIFDCDGVLVDSERLAIDIDVRLCREYGFEITHQEVIDRFLGRRAGLVWEALEEHLGRELTAEEQAYHAKEFWDVYQHRLTAVPGVTEAVDALDYKLCVASSSTPTGLRRKLEHCGLLSRFEPHVFSGDQVEHGKPAPDLFLFAAAQVGVDPARSVVVEDSEHGVNAARAAGMHVFAFVTGMIPVERLDGPGTTLFDDMGQLPQLIATHAG